VKLADAFRRCRESGEAALLGYLCAGDPDREGSLGAFGALARGGCDVLELGLPHSDPIADGPTIQAAGSRALASGMNTDRYFLLAAEVRDYLAGAVPLVCMTYYNLVLRRGLQRFAEQCAASGISGLIIPDLPMEEAGPLRRACAAHDLDLVFLVAPTTSPQRAEALARAGGGFTYLVSRLGVTGANASLSGQVMDLLRRVPPILPRAVGFGVSTPEQVRALAEAGAEGVIVGSAFVELVGGASPAELLRLETLARNLKSATRYPAAMPGPASS